MEIDWEVEIGGGAPVIEADWAGFVDLREQPDRIGEIAECLAFAPLARLLLALNGVGSQVWTAKCDFWEEEEGELAIYIDVLPREGTVFAERQKAEAFCREYVRNLEAIAKPELGANCRVDLVIRQAIAGGVEGFGVTAYLSAKGGGREAAEAELSAVMAGFADALPGREAPTSAG